MNGWAGGWVDGRKNGQAYGWINGVMKEKKKCAQKFLIFVLCLYLRNCSLNSWRREGDGDNGTGKTWQSHCPERLAHHPRVYGRVKSRRASRISVGAPLY